MWPFTRKPSVTDRLLETLREERAATAALQARMLDTMAEQSKFMQRYLGLFEHAPAPQVRVMTDAHEAAYEREREALTHMVNGLSNTVDAFDPSSWAEDIAALKREM